MSIKREAAYHEAGHAVAAYRSKFHNVIGTINLADYGAGEIFIFLSKSKLATYGKSNDQKLQYDKEVAVDLAVVLCAGLVAERIAERLGDGITANTACAEPDHSLQKAQLKMAGLSQNYDLHETTARCLLESEWSLVAELAAMLLKKTSVDAIEVIEFFESRSASGYHPGPIS